MILIYSVAGSLQARLTIVFSALHAFGVKVIELIFETFSLSLPEMNNTVVLTDK